MVIREIDRASGVDVKPWYFGIIMVLMYLKPKPLETLTELHLSLNVSLSSIKIFTQATLASNQSVSRMTTVLRAFPPWNRTIAKC